MTIDQVVTSFIYLAGVFTLFYLGKIVFERVNRSFNLNEQLVKEDNLACSLAVAGYYLGLIFALGGVLSGPATFWVEDLFDIFFYGICSIILLNISSFINDKIILYKFDNTKEIIEDKNAGMGIVEAANYVATGLIVNGAVSGSGDLVTALAFWFMGQIALILASFLYNFITPYDDHAEIEKDNVAVGVSYAGMLIALGNVIRVGISGDFISWDINLTQFASFTLYGVLLLPLLRLITDKIFLPGEKLTDELVNQEKPNIGAGVLEAVSYVAGSILLSWLI